MKLIRETGNFCVLIKPASKIHLVVFCVSSVIILNARMISFWNKKMPRIKLSCWIVTRTHQQLPEKSTKSLSWKFSNSIRVWWRRKKDSSILLTSKEISIKYVIQNSFNKLRRILKFNIIRRLEKLIFLKSSTPNQKKLKKV